jgi:hypothetical protein
VNNQLYAIRAFIISLKNTMTIDSNPSSEGLTPMQRASIQAAVDAANVRMGFPTRPEPAKPATIDATGESPVGNPITRMVACAHHLIARLSNR